MTSLSDLKSVAKHLQDAVAKDRPPTILVGAGLSTDAGFPVVSQIVNIYLAQFHQLLESLPARFAKSQSIQRKVSEYTSRPWEYVRGFGWPNRFDLHEWAQRLSDHTATTAAPDDFRLQLARLVYPEKTYDIDKIIGQLRTLLNTSPSATIAEIERQIADVSADWIARLQYFCNRNTDLANLLFASFGEGRKPVLAHRFLAFLVRRLACKIILTFNFDDLLEQSLSYDSLEHRVFAMEHGGGLPYPSLVSNKLSVIKLHGSTHSLLLDERQRNNLNDAYLSRVQKIIGDSDILVLGLGGDARTQQILTNHLRETNNRVIWLHFESTPPAVATAVAAECNERVSLIRIRNIGAAVLRIHNELSMRYDSSPTPYSVFADYPTLNSQDQSKWESSHEEIIRGWQDNAKAWNLIDNSLVPPEILLRLSTWAAGKGYFIIWVDLESVNTLAGVVAVIIDQCRKCDLDIGPNTLAINSTDFAEAAELITRVLRRHQYLLVIDGIESFCCQLTIHHGYTEWALRSDAQDASEQTTSLIKFIEMLASSLQHTKSRLIASCCKPEARYQKSCETELSELDRNITEALKKAAVAKDVTFIEPQALSASTASAPAGQIAEAPEGSKPELHVEQAAILLSTFRQPRSLVLIQFIEKMFNVKLEGITKAYNDIHLTQLESGAYWWTRTKRNKFYHDMTKESQSEEIKTSDQLSMNFRMAATHQLASRYYYVLAYRQSRDAKAFLEYTYHRLASIRFLVKILRASKTTHIVTNDTLTAVKSQYANCFPRQAQSECAFPADEIGEQFHQFLCRRLIANFDSLREAWGRAEEDLRMQIPAEQLFAWVHEIRQYNLEEPTGVFSEMIAPGRLLKTLEMDVGTDQLQQSLSKFSRDLEQYEIKTHIERSDNDAVIKRIGHSTDDPHFVLDMAYAKMRKAQQETTKLNDLYPQLYAIALSISRNNEEAEARRYAIIGQRALLRASRFSHDGFEKTTPDMISTDEFTGQVDVAIKSGFELIRTAKLSGLGYPRGIIMTPSSDGSVYNQYRSFFHLLNARSLWYFANDNTVVWSAVEDAFEQSRGGIYRQ